MMMSASSNFPALPYHQYVSAPVDPFEALRKNTSFLPLFTIDEPDDGRPTQPSEVAAVTSAMLREIKPLAGAGDIVAGDADDPRRRVAVQVLRDASDYDDLTTRDSNEASVAIETLRSAPGYVYDDKVLAALERVVHDGLLLEHAQ